MLFVSLESPTQAQQKDSLREWQKLAFLKFAQTYAKALPSLLQVIRKVNEELLDFLFQYLMIYRPTIRPSKR